MRPGRLRTALVYFGLLEDPAEATRLPIGWTTVGAIAGATLLGTVISERRRTR